MVAPDKVKQVHRTLLKAIVGMAASGDYLAPLPTSLDRPAVSGSSSDEDLMAVVRDTTPPPAGHSAGGLQPAPSSVIFVASTTPLCSSLSAPLAIPSFGSSDTTVLHTAPFPSAPPAHLTMWPPSVSAVPLTVPPSGSYEAVRRRMALSTAGQHSNLHHLPRPANEVVQSNSVSAFFRPCS